HERPHGFRLRRHRPERRPPAARPRQFAVVRADPFQRRRCGERDGRRPRGSVQPRAGWDRRAVPAAAPTFVPERPAPDLQPVLHERPQAEAAGGAQRREPPTADDKPTPAPTPPNTTTQRSPPNTAAAETTRTPPRPKRTARPSAT